MISDHLLPEKEVVVWNHLNNAANIPYLAIKVGRLQSNKEGVYLESKRNKAILIFEAWQGKSTWGISSNLSSAFNQKIG